MNNEKVITARLMRIFPLYVEQNYGLDAKEEYLMRTGVSSDDLSDPDAWVSWGQYLRMLDELVRLTGDGSSPYKAGVLTASKGVLNEAWHLLFTGLVNVKTVFRALVRIGHMYNRSADWEILDITGSSVRLRINWKDGIRTNRASCLNRQGMLASIPTMFGMPEARSSELQCQADGHDSCVEEYTWQNPLRRAYTLWFLATGAVVAVSSALVFSAGLPFAMSIAIISILAGFIVDDAVIMKAKSALYAEQNAELERLVKRLEDRYAELKKATEEKQRMEEEIFKARQIESLGLLAGGIAHDFNNVLGTILSHVSMAKLSLADTGKTIAHIEAAERGFDRAKRLTGQMITFSRGGAPVKDAVDLGNLIADTADFALKGTGVRGEYSIQEDLWAANADDGQISQVISNIVINACQAMPDGGVIGIKARNVQLEDHEVPPLERGEYVHISIEDSGAGIPQEYLERIFEPFFTTKSSGSGLGLSIANSIIKKHDGSISVESAPGKTVFHIYLPALKNNAPARTATADDGVIYKGAGKILVMDDDGDFSAAIRESLMDLGYEVELALDGVEALAKYRKAIESGRKFDAVILDLTNAMGMGGAEAMKQLLEIDHDVKAVASSGYSNDPVMSRYDTYGFKATLIKPYTIQKLSKTLHKLLAAQQ